MNRFAVLLSGEITPTRQLRLALRDRRLVAADGGIRHAETFGLVPEIWVGDFDSVPPALSASLAEVPRETWPADKDRTDGSIAIEAAIRHGADDILVVGALGGKRFDHAFTNLALLLAFAERGVSMEMFDGQDRAVALGSIPRTVDATPGATFSILLFGDVHGLSVRGARWPLSEVDVAFGDTLTQSNEATGPITATVAAGRAVLLVRP